MLRALKLPTVSRCAEEIATKAEREGWSFGQYLHHLAELEDPGAPIASSRAPAPCQSNLPAEKTLATNSTRPSCRRRSRRSCRPSATGDFVERGDNVLAFGLPGRGQDASRRAPSVTSSSGAGDACWFTPTYALVQMLLGAKRDLRLEKELAALDTFDAVILDSC